MVSVGIVGGLGPESTVDLLPSHPCSLGQGGSVELAGVPVLDTTGLHVAAIVQRLRGSLREQ